jgi:tetratricopeptide (TPR) repeat protein
LQLRRARTWLGENRAALALLLLPVLVYLFARYAAIGAFAPARLDPLLEVASSTRERLLTALQAWPWYVRLHFLPTPLLADYGPRMILPATGWTPAALTGAVVLSSLTAGGVIALAKGHRRFALALLWFTLAVLPVSNLVVPIGVLVAERTLYLPSFALAVGASGLAAWLLRTPGTVQRAGIASFAAILVLFALRTFTRTPDWKSTDSVMVALVRDRPDSFRGHWHVARMARVREDVAQAAAEYETAVQLWPYRKRLVVEAAAYLASARLLDRAARTTDWAARQWPDDVDIQRMRAGIALDLGDRATARAAVDSGLRLRPDDEMLRRMAAALDSLPDALPHQP